MPASAHAHLLPLRVRERIRLRSAMRFTARLLLTALLLCAARAHCASAGKDLTSTFLQAYANACAFGSAHLKALRGHEVLLVPGYMSHLYPDYFVDQLRWLSSVGVSHRKLAIIAGDSIEVNGTLIAGAIRDAAKPVILITHSKGSVDALQALLAEPALRAKVKGWISLQGAFLGSPVADTLLDGSRVNPLFASLILGFLGGSHDSAQGLTTARSSAYYRKHAAAIERLLREVPAIAFASALDAAPGPEPRTSLEIPYEMMMREGLRNDGLIPLNAAVLPGMDFVKVSGVDHIAPVMPARLPFNRVRMTQALLLALPLPLRALPPDANCTTRR